MTYQQAAQTAIDVQDASNLSGVVKSLAGPVMDALWEESRRIGKGTKWINEHPIVTLFLSKLASLNRSQDCSFEKYCEASDAVEKIAAEATATT